MNKILFFLLVFFSCLGHTGYAQSPCASVSVAAFPMNPQTGAHNYFGVIVTLSQTYDQDVTVTGYIYDDGDGGNTDHPFSLTVTAGTLTVETDVTFYQTGPASGADVNVTSVSPCPGGGTVTYAGVQITYETSSGMLKFNSVSDVNTVIEQLNTDYETYNNNYDNQYPTLTADQLDDMDVINNFDEFSPIRQFEASFSGFISKRSQIENVENTWLANNMTGTDPDDIDESFDDAQNAIFNNNYSFKVGSSLYELRSEGLYVNGILQDDGGASMSFGTVCKSNKKVKTFSPEYENGTRRFKIKVSINSIAVRSGVHGKAVHFKKKNGSWKRKRAEMAVGCAGTIYNGSCTSLFQFTDRKPFSGYSKRKQLATRRHTGAQPPSNSTIWKTYSGEVASSFSTPNTSIAGTLLLTF